MPTKRTTVVMLLSVAAGLMWLAIQLEPAPLMRPTLEIVALQMLFWGSISAALSAARTSGLWGDRIVLGSGRRVQPQWLWPAAFAVLAVINYLIALAVLLGTLPFSGRAADNDTASVVRDETLG